MENIESKNKIEFSLEDANSEIEVLLKKYRTRKDELEWADDEWEESEIQEELDGYAKKINALKAKIKEYNKKANV